MNRDLRHFEGEFTRLFETDHLLDVNLLLRQAGEHYTDAELSQDELDQFYAKEDVKIAKRNIQDAETCLSMLSDYDSWTPVREEDGIATFCKGAGEEYFVRAEMTVNQGLFPVTALFSEVDLYSLL